MLEPELDTNTAILSVHFVPYYSAVLQVVSELAEVAEMVAFDVLDLALRSRGRDPLSAHS